MGSARTVSCARRVSWNMKSSIFRDFVKRMVLNDMGFGQ